MEVNDAIYVLKNTAFLSTKKNYGQVDEAIDAIEAEIKGKHAYWTSEDFSKCSNCGHEAYSDTDYGKQLFKYCPYCGARMDGEEK